MDLNTNRIKFSLLKYVVWYVALQGVGWYIADTLVKNGSDMYFMLINSGVLLTLSALFVFDVWKAGLKIQSLFEFPELPTRLLFYLLLITILGIIVGQSFGFLAGHYFPKYLHLFEDKELHLAIYGMGNSTVKINSFILVLVIAPVTEEVFFRWFLLHKIAAKFPIWVAVGISSVLFGIMHPAILPQLILGVVFCIFYIKTKSLVYSITLHVMNNFVAEISHFIHHQIYGESAEFLVTEFKQMGFGEINIAVCWAVFALFLIILICVLRKDLKYLRQPLPPLPIINESPVMVSSGVTSKI